MSVLSFPRVKKLVFSTLGDSSHLIECTISDRDNFLAVCNATGKVGAE